MSAKTGLCHHLCLVMADRRHFLTFFDAFQRFSTLFDAFRRFSTFFDVFQRFSTFIRKKYQRTPFNFCLTRFIEQLCFVWTVLGSGDASGSDDGIQKSSSKILHPELFFIRSLEANHQSCIEAFDRKCWLWMIFWCSWLACLHGGR